MASVERDVAAGAHRSLADAARATGAITLSTAGKMANRHFKKYQVATKRDLGPCRRISCSFDETDLGGEGTMGLAIYAPSKRKGAWLAPQVTITGIIAIVIGIIIGTA